MNLDFENLTDDDKSMIVVVGSVDRLLSNNVLRGEKTMLLTEKGRQIFERLEKEDYYVSPDKIMGLVSYLFDEGYLDENILIDLRERFPPPPWLYGG